MSQEKSKTRLMRISGGKRLEKIREKPNRFIVSKNKWRNLVGKQLYYSDDGIAYTEI